MSDILLVRIDQSNLFPEFLRRLKALLDDAQHNHSSSYWVISGHRGYLEQNDLYAKGRTTPGKVVTNAKGGQSAHCFGIAADLCLDGLGDRAGLQPDYRPESYELLRELAPKHRLVWGGTFKSPDRPHVQLPGFVTSTEMKPLRDRYEARGLSAVFTYLEEQPS